MPERTSLSVLSLAIGSGLVGAQPLQDDVAIDMSGIGIVFPFNDQERDSENHPLDGTPEAINTASGYRFQVQGDAIVTILGIEFYSGPIEPLFDFIEPGQANLLTGYARNNAGVIPPGGLTVWQESFGGGLFTVNISITLEFSIAPDGVVTFRARDIQSDLGILGSIVFPVGIAELAVWTPSEPQLSEWRFDGGFEPAGGSDDAALRYLDDPAFGDILVGVDADAVPDPTIPKGVTQAQSAFVSTADEGLPPVGADHDTVYRTSPAFNLSDPLNQDWRRGVGLVAYPSARPEYPGGVIGQWTMVWDLLIPSAAWFEDAPANTQPREFVAAVLQADHNNETGASLWIRNQSGQIGIIWADQGEDFTEGFVPLPITPDSWFRLAVVCNEFNQGASDIYVDGVFVGSTASGVLANNTDPTAPAFVDTEPVDTGTWDAWDRFPSPWALSSGVFNPDFDGDPQPSNMVSTYCMFADWRFGGSQTVYVANYAFVDDTLESADVAALAGPDGAGIFDLADPCPPDLNDDGALDFFDVSAFLAAFNANDPIADFNDDGAFDFFDVSAYLSAFNAGCDP